MSAIVDFLSGVGGNACGERVDEVLALDDAALERRHDFIQWLFPLQAASAAVPGSPVLSRDDVATIQGSSAARRTLAAAAARMAAFYARGDAWLASHDHNHLRITRIIRSLRLLTGDAAADAFRLAILARVRATDARINAVSRRYWMEA